MHIMSPRVFTTDSEHHQHHFLFSVAAGVRKASIVGFDLLPFSRGLEAVLPARRSTICCSCPGLEVVSTGLLGLEVVPPNPKP